MNDNNRKKALVEFDADDLERLDSVADAQRCSRAALIRAATAVGLVEIEKDPALLLLGRRRPSLPKKTDNAA